MYSSVSTLLLHKMKLKLNEHVGGAVGGKSPERDSSGEPFRFLDVVGSGVGEEERGGPGDGESGGKKRGWERVLASWWM